MCVGVHMKCLLSCSHISFQIADWIECQSELKSVLIKGLQSLRHFLNRKLTNGHPDRVIPQVKTHPTDCLTSLPHINIRCILTEKERNYMMSVMLPKLTA